MNPPYIYTWISSFCHFIKTFAYVITYSDAVMTENTANVGSPPSSHPTAYYTSVLLMKPCLLSDLLICLTFSLFPSWYCDRRFLVPLCCLMSWRNISKLGQFLLGCLLSLVIVLVETSARFSLEKNYPTKECMFLL